MLHSFIAVNLMVALRLASFVLNPRPAVVADRPRNPNRMVFIHW